MAQFAMMLDEVQALRSVVAETAKALGCEPDNEAMLAKIEQQRAALMEIRDHWANDYDHPRKNNEMYRGPYGIGVTDGHRACAAIARRALGE